MFLALGGEREEAMVPSSRTLRTTTLVVAVLLCVTAGSCRKKGPLQRAGEKVDKAAESVGDAVDPKGPAEKAGRAVDKAVDDLED
jgi:hypothetical protein